MAYGASAQAWDAKRSDGDMLCNPMGAEKIYAGTLVYYDADGFVCQVADAATGDMFAGVAAETVDNSGGSPGDKSIHYWITGVFTFKHAGAARTDVGLPAYASLGVADAGQTVKSSTEGTHAMMVGTIVGVSAESSATTVQVLIDMYTAIGGAETSVIGGYST